MCTWTRHGDTISTSCGESEEERREKWKFCPYCQEEIKELPVGMTQGEWFVDRDGGFCIVTGGEKIIRFLGNNARANAMAVSRLPEIIKAANRVRDQGIPSGRIPSVIHMLLDAIDAAKQGQ